MKIFSALNLHTIQTIILVYWGRLLGAMHPLLKIRLPETVCLTRVKQQRQLGVQQIVAVLKRMSPRERGLVTAAGATMGVLLLYLGLIEPVWEAHTRLQARVAAKERELREVIRLRQRYRALSRTAAHRKPHSSLPASPFAFLETLATSALGPGKVTAINPVGRVRHEDGERETIEMHLQGVSLRELIDLLYKVDAADGVVQPTRLAIKKQYKDPYRFDVTLTTTAHAGK